MGKALAISGRPDDSQVIGFYNGFDARFAHPDARRTKKGNFRITGKFCRALTSFAASASPDASPATIIILKSFAINRWKARTLNVNRIGQNVKRQPFANKGAS